MKNDNNRIEARSFEDILADPSFAHVHEAMRYLQRTPSKDIFPKKHELSLLGLVREDTVAFFNREPNTPFKTVIATIIAGSNDDVSADIILKMTKNIIEVWEIQSNPLVQEDTDDLDEVPDFTDFDDYEEVLKDSSLMYMHELAHCLQKIPNKDIFPEKYELSILDLAMEDTVELFHRDPNMPLKTVISTIITCFEDDLSADLILKMTKRIIEKWEKLSVVIPKKKSVAVAAEMKNWGSNAVVFEK